MRLTRPTLPTLLTLALAVAAAGFLGGLVGSRDGNLAWDDAGYLGRGLRLARIARQDGAAAAIAQTLRERPKPPLLIAWIEVAALAVGRSHRRGLIVLASVGPFALLAAGVVGMARRLGSAWAGFWALALLLTSPLALLLGAKVMVESFMGLWVLLTLASAVAVLQRPTLPRAAAVGTFLGLAALTKMTVVLLLPAPLAVAAMLFARRYPLDRRAARLAVVAGLSTLVVAGPWYARNGRAAVAFARFSSRYNVEAEGRADLAPRWTRWMSLTREMSGPPAAALAVAAVVAWAGRRGAGGRSTGADRDLAFLTGAGVIAGAVALLKPPYFDPRFLLPIWPAATVGLGGWIARHAQGARGAAVAGVLGLGMLQAGRGVLADPVHTTYWSARSLIDDLVSRHGVATIANVGNSPHWNVAKTGLINELRARPGDCFVQLDLSRDTPDVLERRLARLDAVLVLRPDALPASYRAVSPGLNRSYETIVAILEADPRFERLAPPAVGGLPPLAIYLRRAPLTAQRPPAKPARTQ